MKLPKLLLNYFHIGHKTHKEGYWKKYCEDCNTYF